MNADIIFSWFSEQWAGDMYCRHVTAIGLHILAFPLMDGSKSCDG